MPIQREIMDSSERNNITKLLQEVIDNIILESKKKAFKSEDEIQGYISGNLRYLLEDNFEVIREFPTSEKYKRAKDGILFKNVTGKHGFIDLVIKKNGFPLAGIEVEYPRGGGLKNIQNFTSHLKNDILKLALSKNPVIYQNLRI